MKSSPNNLIPLFCIDVTSDKNSDRVNGSEFISRTASIETMEEYENKQERLEQTVEKSKLPIWLQILKFVCGIFFLIILASTVKAGLDTALKNAPILVLVGAVCGIIWLVLYIVSKIKEKKVFTQENAEQQSEEIDEDVKSIRCELDVPSNAVDVDVLGFRYKLKKGEIQPQHIGLQTSAYINVNVKIYATSDELHIADLQNVYSFDRSEISGIRMVNKRISVPSWNKEEDPRKGIFKPYKMTVNNTGDVFFKPYYILEIYHGGKLFGLYFPCYELETFKKLTGLNPRDDSLE